MKKERQEGLRGLSGEVSSNDPMVIFFYLLLQRELSCGKVEDLLLEVFKNTNVQFANGWLAKYAQNIVDTLKTPCHSVSDEKEFCIESAVGACDISKEDQDALLGALLSEEDKKALLTTFCQQEDKDEEN